MESRIEKDSLGEIEVPSSALYGAQTQRAVGNFSAGGIGFSRLFIRSLGYIKHAAADVNERDGNLDPGLAEAIRSAAQEVIDGRLDEHFVVDVFQTGSGTSTNMNANEVIANRAIELLGGVIGTKSPVHPNDHVNMSQSSNDVIPTAIHVSSYLAATGELLPALQGLHDSLRRRAAELDDVVKTGRTHLMDAMPIRFGQQLNGYAEMARKGIARVESTLPRLAELAIGGTAVGTGVNSRAGFGKEMATRLADLTGCPFVEASDHFEAQGAQDAALELSGQLKTLAGSLKKIADDFRWMSSGPNSGLNEIILPAVQPGSSIMPGKVNPVIGEALTLACAQVIGNDTAVTIGASSGSFELNLMLPLIAHNLLQSISLLAGSTRSFTENTIDGFTVNRDYLEEQVSRNPILVTALVPLIGYDLASSIAKRAMAEDRPVIDVAKEMTELSVEQLSRLLDPKSLTYPGLAGSKTNG